MLEIEDALAAYLFDAAVVTFGTVIENALAETDGEGDKRRPRYTLRQLLADDFHLPRTGIAHDPLPTEIDGAIYDEVGV